MTYGVLTTRHHDGFALWPSSVGNFNVRNIPWMNGQGDVVRAYVDAFRAKGPAPGLYYSVWDNTAGHRRTAPSRTRADGLRHDADHRAADQLRPDSDPDHRRLVVADGPQGRPRTRRSARW